MRLYYRDNRADPSSQFSLLFPSFLFAAGVTIASWTIAFNYYPEVSQHDRSRLFPDFSVGVATAVGLIAANVVVFGLWRIRSLTPMMFKYFTVLSTRPSTFSMLGATFSHQELWHIGFNMYALFAFGSTCRFIPVISVGKVLQCRC